MTLNKQNHVRPAKTLINPGIRPVYQSCRCSNEEACGSKLPIERTAKTDKTGRLHRLI